MTNRTPITVTVPLTAPASQAALAQDSVEQPLALGALSGLPLRAVVEPGTLRVRLTPTDAPDAEALVLADEGARGALCFDDGRLLEALRLPSGLQLTLRPAPGALVAPPAFTMELTPALGAPPAALQAAAAAQADADRPDVAAGLLLRWAWSTQTAAGSAAHAQALAWWARLDAAQRGTVEAWAQAQADALIDVLDDVLAHLRGEEAAPLPAGALEVLAADRDALASSCTLLLAVGAGGSARRSERVADDLLRAVYAAVGPQPAFADPALRALAQQGAGWWCAAPGAEAPALDEDVLRVDPEDEQRFAEDVEAFAAEAAEAAEAALPSDPDVGP